MKRIIVTGSRDWKDYLVVYKVLTLIKAKHGEFLLMHGGCPRGVDAFADSWAKKQGWRPEVFEADWDRHGRAAGPLRNAQMVKAGADYCLGFPHPVGPSVGTLGCMDLAKKAGIPTYRVDSEGRATRY